MELNDELIEHLSELSRLSFTGEGKEEIKKDLEKITDFMSELSKVDTEGVEPLVYLSDEINVLREDIPHQELTHEEILRNAPKKDSDYFRIPKVLDKTIDDEEI